ncbi:MAG: flagellar biosynthetic protein FliR [Rhodospirillales bacterium]|nr:flagellar biosynthetic protein FliR [Rhodospirillales bacterium]
MAIAFAFVLVLTRVAAGIMVLPGVGGTDLPRIARAGFALAFTLLILPVAMPSMPPMPAAPARAAAMVLGEVLTGAWLGWLARVPAMALPMAGQIIAYMTGQASVLEPDTQMGMQSTVFGRAFGLAATTLIMASGLWAIPIAAVAKSFRLIAPGSLLPTATGAAAATEAVARGFAVALRLSSPFVVIGIVWQVGVGAIARLVPRLQIYFLAMPAQILGGMILLALLAGAVLAGWETAITAAFDRLPGAG